MDMSNRCQPRWPANRDRDSDWRRLPGTPRQAFDGALLGAPLDAVDGFGSETGLAYTPDQRFVVVGSRQSGEIRPLA
jgi:hypothetical protein